MTYHTYFHPANSMTELEIWLVEWKQSKHTKNGSCTIQNIPNSSLQLETKYVQTALTFLRIFRARCLILTCLFQTIPIRMTISLQTGQVIVAIPEEHQNIRHAIAQEFSLRSRQ